MFDQAPKLTITEEARRQVEICNACRYCEGYCAVFPSAFSQRAFSDGDITQLASLCHNCRGCYYACQYTDPHEFALTCPARWPRSASKAGTASDGRAASPASSNARAARWRSCWSSASRRSSGR